MISVIIPVYNVEEYLPTCIESILHQTYKDLEILLIDDGSTDNSGKICDEYAKQDKRCIVIHQSNKGVATVRNTGLIQATGEYITFIDSDDYIHPQMLEILYKGIKIGNYDFSIVAHKQVWEYIQENSIGNGEKIELTQDDLMKGLYNHLPNKNIFKQPTFDVLWSKLYKKELLNNLKFIQTGCEDTEFCNRIYLRTQKAIFINYTLYYWRQRSLSVSHHPTKLLYIYRADSYYHCLNNIPKNKDEYRSYCLEKIYKAIINGRYYAKGTNLSKESAKLTRFIKRKTIKEFISNKYIKIPLKIGLLTFYYIPIIYTIFINTLELKSKRHQ